LCLSHSTVLGLEPGLPCGPAVHPAVETAGCEASHPMADVDVDEVDRGRTAVFRCVLAGPRCGRRRGDVASVVWRHAAAAAAAADRQLDLVLDVEEDRREDESVRCAADSRPSRRRSRPPGRG